MAAAEQLSAELCSSFLALAAIPIASILVQS